MNDGWVKIYRSLLEWEWYQDINVKSVFLHLLLKANFEEKRWQGITIKRGQLITSVAKIFLELNKNPKHPQITTQNIRTALTKLKSTNELTIETTSQYTLITVNKYNDFQESTNEVTNDQQTTNKQLTTTKEYKNIRNKEDINIKPVKKKKHLYQVGEVTDEMCKEIAIQYQLYPADVYKTREKMILYCGSTGTQYADYRLTIMNWLRSALDKGQIRKMPAAPEPLPETKLLSPEQIAKNNIQLAEIRKKLSSKLVIDTRLSQS